MNRQIHFNFQKPADADTQETVRASANPLHFRDLWLLIEKRFIENSIG